MTHPFSREDYLQVLSSSRLFSRFSVERLVHLLSYSESESFSAGDVILRQGQPNDKIFILISGMLQVFSEGEFILRLRRKGDIVGEVSFLSKKTASATVSAYTDVDLFSISAASVEAADEIDLLELLKQVFLDILTQKLALTTNMVKGFQVASEELIQKKQELAKSEGDLHQKEAILQEVLGSMSDGVVVLDILGKTMHINKAFQRMVGQVSIPDNIRDWPASLGLYKSDEKTPLDTDYLLNFGETAGVVSQTKEMFLKNDRNPDGVWLQASGNRLQFPGENSVYGTVIVCRDFTKIKEEERALIKARDHAEAVAKTKTDFLSTMSHELRTPLNGIIGMVDLLSSNSLDENQNECVNSIKVSSENLLRLVQNILDYSNLESNNVEVDIVTIELLQFVNDVSEQYQKKATQKGLDFSTAIDERIPRRFHGFATGIQQIIVNLLDNAIKFTGSGFVKLSFSLLEKRDDQVDFVISVKDSGIGIHEKDMPGLFEPFSQLDSSISRRFDGSGIGLSVCKKYARLMNTEIRIDSQPGVGSTFYFTLNNIRSVSEQISPSKQSAQKPNKTLDLDFAKSLPLNILVVEDNKLNQTLISKMFKSLGYQPELANNGQEAVDRCLREEYDVIFMDLNMPIMGGIEASVLVRENSSSSRPPTIIALTATVSDDIKKQCFEAGMMGFLTKPIKRDRLVDVLYQFAPSE